MTITIPNGPKVGRKLYLRLQQDINTYGRAYLAHWFLGWYRINPDKVTVLNPIYSKEAEEAARKEGILVEGVGGVH